MAPQPGDAMLGDVSEGSWVYWIEPGDFANMELPKQVRAELYRVDNALTNEGQRLVSDSLPGKVPDNLPDLSLIHISLATRCPSACSSWTISL